MKIRIQSSNWAPMVALTCLLASLLIVACRTVPETGRKQLNFLNPAEEAAMGLSEFRKIKKEKPISQNPEMNAIAQRVGQRLARVMPIQNAEWEFVVFEDSTPNAFALPGGKVGIHSGLFQITKNEAGLAAVVGHEVAHVVARHAGERLSQNAVAGVVAAGAGYALGDNTRERAIASAALGGGTVLATRAFSRKQELEADKMGALYMARAGYDPRESVGLWQHFGQWRAESGGANTPVFLSTHPLDERRIAELQAFMPQAMAEYSGGNG